MHDHIFSQLCEFHLNSSQRHLNTSIKECLLGEAACKQLHLYLGRKKHWAQFHNQGFTLSVNPCNCWPRNFKWFADQYVLTNICTTHVYVHAYMLKFYILLLTFLINLSGVCTILFEIVWINCYELGPSSSTPNIWSHQLTHDIVLEFSWSQ